MKGVTLVEVLVALVVLSVGLLGLAGLLTFVVREAGDAARLAERSRVLAEVHDSLVAAGVEGAGAREAVGESIRWRPLDTAFPGTEDVGLGELEIVVPKGRSADPDTLRIPIEAAVEGS